MSSSSTTEERQKPLDTSVPLLAGLDPVLSTPQRRQFSRIAVALLTMTGRVTLRGMARWTDQGGS